MSEGRWMRTIRCHCGEARIVEQGSVMNEADHSGFFPVFHFGGEIQWFCPQHTEELKTAMRALAKACGGNVNGLVPPMMRKMLEGT